MAFGAAALVKDPWPATVVYGQLPGGNDVLLLNAIPGLSPHAVPAYLAMLAGIAIALMVMK